jgi:hypothetical protein
MIQFRVKISLRLLAILSLVIIPVVSRSQSVDEMKKIFAQAESYYLYGEYELANQLYILLDSPDNQNIKYKIGVCYLNIPGEKEKSVPFLEEAVKNASYDSKEDLYKEKRAPLDAYFYLAKAYMTNNELEKGLNTFETFNRLAGETKSKGGMENLDYVGLQIEACRNAISMKENPKAFSKKTLGSDFSSGSMNENPAVSFDGNTIVYTERRGITNAIWFSKKNRGAWQVPVEITADLKAGEDCSSCSLNNDGTELYLYKTDNFDGAIYTSTYVNNAWTPVRKLNKNINTKFYESHATVSADGKRLYFTSNRDGGQGNLDIYVSEKDASGEWGPAKNLGPAINTPYNEDTPFITANDSMLYFCSEGHSSMGGFDIFSSAKKGSEWQAPVNLGYPVNTTDDDRFLLPANNGMNAFYSITTDYKKKEIFYLNFGNILFDIKGKIALSDTTLMYDDNFSVQLTNKATGKTMGKITPDGTTGNYSFPIKQGKYNLLYTGAGYFSQSVDTTVNADYPLSEIFIDVTLKRDSTVARPKLMAEYEKINLSDIPTVAGIDSSLLIRDMVVKDVTEDITEDPDILYYTVQVMALYNPVDISFFRYITDLKVMYNEDDKFYRYITGNFATREDALKWRTKLRSKGYPEDIFIKKVSRKLVN